MQKSIVYLRLFLLFAPGLLAEILSGNTPISKLFNPFDLFFLVLAYGVPIILIWEYKVKYSLSFLSVFFLGIAYGVFNEGLMAKTILETSMIPFGGFRTYEGMFGLNPGWSMMILPWHAFFSVIFPFALAEAFFPEAKNTSLISDRWKYTFLFITFVFLPIIGKEWQGVVSPGLYILFYGSILMLFFFSRTISRYKFTTQPGRGLLLGITTIFVYLFLFIAPGKIPLLLYTIIAIISYVVIMKRFLILSSGERAKFAYGCYIAFGGFATLISIFAGRIDLIIMYFLFMGILFISLRKKDYF